MSFITATDLQAQAAATPTQADLDTKYAATKTVLQTQAREGFYTADITIGSKDLNEFNTWIASYGFRVITPPDTVQDALPARDSIVGTRTIKRISWQTFTVQATPLAPSEGQTITYSIITKGVDDSTVLYWRTAGQAIAADFQDTTLEGTVTISNNAGTVTRNVRIDALTEPSETVIFNLYWDSARTDLVATNGQVSLVSNVT
jgi:hypothetical protein